MAADGITAALALLVQPIPHLIDPYPTDLKAARNFRRTLAAIQCPQHPLPQILGIRLHPMPLLCRQKHYRTNVYTSIRNALASENSGAGFLPESRKILNSCSPGTLVSRFCDVV